MAAVSAVLTAIEPARASTLVLENFRGTAVAHPDKWVRVNSSNTLRTPCLTAGTATTQAPVRGCDATAIDASGQGVARLTDAVGGRAGALLFNHPQPATAGLDITFSQAQYGGSGADGIGFFLVDGATNLTAPGPSGGSLGYSTSQGLGGLGGALLGVGLDAWGNFAATYTDGSGCTPSPYPTRMGNNVVVRGPGSGTAGYCYLGSSKQSGHNVTLHSPSNTTRAAATRVVRIVVDPTSNADPKVTVSVDNTQVVQVAAPTALRNATTFKYGFSASTGSVTNVHEIWDVQITSVDELPPGSGLDESSTTTAPTTTAPTTTAPTTTAPTTTAPTTTAPPMPPGLQLDVTTEPANPIPGTDTTIVYEPGTDPTQGAEPNPVTIVHDLPDGITVTNPPEAPPPWNCTKTKVTTARVECTYTPVSPIPPGQRLKKVKVKVRIPRTVQHNLDLSDGARVTDGSRQATAPSNPYTVVRHQGYWAVAANGTVYAFGTARHYGSASQSAMRAPIVTMLGAPNGTGYYVVSTNGVVTAFGSARWHGDLRGVALNAPIVGAAGTPNGRGYWVVGSDGGVFAFGNAKFFGSLGDRRLTAPVVGITRTKSGRGYWLVDRDGEVYAFGDATKAGSLPSRSVSNPSVVAVATAATNAGYWLSNGRGVVWAFGDRSWSGDTRAIPLVRPVVAMAATTDGAGYRLFAADGGVFCFGRASFEGSLGGASGRLPSPIVGGAAATE